MKRLIEVALAGAVVAVSLLLPAQVSTRSTAPHAERPADEFLLAPVRVHLLRSHEAPAANTELTDADVTRIFRKVNEIWHAAGIHFWVETVLAEKPERVDGYESDLELPLNALMRLRPPRSMPDGRFHVYYLGAMVANGLYVGRDAIFVMEHSRLVPVPGGIDEPLPRVTAHELGHALGLKHRDTRTLLLSSGTTGIRLEPSEVETARLGAAAFSWIQSPEALLKEADTLAAEGKKPEAELRYRVLTALPGASAFRTAAEERLGGHSRGGAPDAGRLR